MLKKTVKTNNYIFEFDYESKLSKKMGRNKKNKKKMIVTKKTEEGKIYFTSNIKFLIFSKVLNQIKEKYAFKESITRRFILNLLNINITSHTRTFTNLYESSFLDLKREGRSQNTVLGEVSINLFDNIEKNLELKKLYLDYKQKIEGLYNKETKEFKTLIDREIELENKKIITIFNDSISLN